MYKRIFDIENKLDEGMFLFGARQTDISATTFSDLLHGRRASYSLDELAGPVLCEFTETSI